MSKWRVPFIDLPTEYKTLEKEILKEIKGVLSSGRFILGKQVEKFEKEIAEYLGVKYTIGVNSGTDALFLSLKALSISSGDEVITVAHTHVSTIAVIVHLGATPILVDIGEDYNMDTSLLEKAITPKTKAIIPVHLNGRCCDIDNITKWGIPVVEDACQALGAEYKGKKAGTFGIGCFSFHPLKTLSAAGDGGLVATNDERIADKIKLLRNHGTLDKVHYVDWGYNSRLDELQASILSVKLKHLDEWIVKRRIVAARYSWGLRQPPILIPLSSEFDTYNSYIIRAQRRDKLKVFLEKQGIETFVNWSPPLHKQLGLNFNLPMTEKISDEVLSLPIHPYLSDGDVKYVADSIREFYE